MPDDTPRFTEVAPARLGRALRLDARQHHAGRRVRRPADGRHARLGRRGARSSRTTYAASAPGPLTGAGQHPRALGPPVRQRDDASRSSATCRSTRTDWAAEHMEVSRRTRLEQYEQVADHPRARRDPRDHARACRPAPSPPRSRSTSGDRHVELIHPGRGHTAGDLVVRVPDADVLLAGDLVEESDPPFIGDDSLAAGVAADPRPGARPDDRRHRGRARAREARRQGLRAGPAHRARRHRRDHPRPRRAAACPSEALADRRVALGPRALLERAVRLGYEHLPRSQKRLPLI